MAYFLEPIKPEDHLPIREKVYNILREAILSGAMEPGERVVEREIAVRMAVSRTPIREAIRQLEIEGLVKHVPRKGVVVTGIRDSEVDEIYLIRGALEGLAVRLAAERISDRDLEKLKKKMSQMKVAVAAGKTNQLNKLHLELNELMYRSAECSRLYQMICTVQEYVEKLTGIGYSTSGRIHEATEEHQRIVDAIAARQGEKAEAEVKAHMANSLRAYRQGLSEKAEKAASDQKNNSGRQKSIGGRKEQG